MVGNFIKFNTNVVAIVVGLINAINDGVKEVRDFIHSSLCQIGHHEPQLVLSKGLTFLNSTSKSNRKHRVLVMNVLSEVLDNNEFNLDLKLGSALVVCAATEIVSDKVILRCKES